MKAYGIFFLVLCIWLGVSLAAQAQTHPCDATITPNPTITNPLIVVGFCHNGQDLDGNSTTIMAFKIYVDNLLVLTWTSPTPTGAPSATGYSYFQTIGIAVSRGTHAVAATAMNIDGDSVMSASFSFNKAGKVPKAVVAVRAQ